MNASLTREQDFVFTFDNPATVEYGLLVVALVGRGQHPLDLEYLTKAHVVDFLWRKNHKNNMNRIKEK